MSGSCFVIMPMSTPRAAATGEYHGDEQHFTHVLERLFIPAIEMAGMTPLLPMARDSEVIQAGIITKLAEADLVLCDLTLLNPNVFFELGIRTALNKPVALVRDDTPTIDVFDIANIQYHTYPSAPAWQLSDHIVQLSEHLRRAGEGDGTNWMWKVFSLNAARTSPDEHPVEAKLDLLLRDLADLRNQVSAARTARAPSDSTPTTLSSATLGFVQRVGDLLGTARVSVQQNGPKGVTLTVKEPLTSADIDQIADAATTFGAFATVRFTDEQGQRQVRNYPF